MNVKNILYLLLLLLLVSIPQFFLAYKHLQFGFFTDDWLFLSAYRAYVTNPLFDLLSAWKNISSHNFAHSYYIGILFNFFGLNYIRYHILNQILKIISILTLYPLVYIVSKNKLLAILSTIVYALHYSAFGSLDNASRGEDFIAIASMNLFLAYYIYVIKKGISNILLLLGLSVWLFTTILIDDTRLFPLIFLVPLIELIGLKQMKGKVLAALKRLGVLFSPFIPLYIFSPESIAVQLRYSIGIFEQLKVGNWQLFLTPFASFGSTFIPRDFWFLFGPANLNRIGDYLVFLLPGPLLIFFFINIFLGFFVSKKPLRFIFSTLFLNLIVGICVFFIANNWIFLSGKLRTPVDPGTYLTPALIGIFVMIQSSVLLLEWKKYKQNNILPLIFLSCSFSLIVIYLTWIFADFNSIFTGVHPYLNIPSIGTSIALAAFLLLIYKKLENLQVFGKKKLAGILVVVLLLSGYFKISSRAVDEYFSYWLANGLKASDQDRIMNQFWQGIGSKFYTIKNQPLVYFDSSEDYVNGTFYAESIIWKTSSWFDLRYKKNKEGRFYLCQILNPQELKKYVTISPDGNIITSTKCGETAYDSRNFIAIRLKNRSLIFNRQEVLQQLSSNAKN